MIYFPSNNSGFYAQLTLAFTLSLPFNPIFRARRICYKVCQKFAFMFCCVLRNRLL
ncbi:hypothetical protein HMPREF3208_00716 [Gardnerella vaginalis]|uniref:Uncharacterized protein n=1 Tax=Gardnerella vaginalis TaxID=2702 RepID=A0A133NX81_GARVA|nr:hypothetical protein HMPREF3208_00716 [Gardnerella vaginalis]